MGGVVKHQLIKNNIKNDIDCIDGKNSSPLIKTNKAISR